jgi:hypothetical protein
VPSRLPSREIAGTIPNAPRWVQETVRRYNQEGLEALKDKRHQTQGRSPSPREVPKAFLRLPGCIPFRLREASFPLSLPAGFMRRGQGILGNIMHAGPRSRPF